MGVDVRAGIAFGVKLTNDELYEALEKFATAKMEKFIADGHTEEEWKQWISFEDAIDISKDELYEDGILINLDMYSNCVNYILGYSLDSIEWDCKPFDCKNITGIEVSDMEKKIAEWYQKLFPDKEMPAPQLLLYSQLC